MNSDLYYLILEALLDEAELNEFSAMGGGAVGGVATPLGTGPKAGSKGENIYKSSTATDTKHRSKKKKSSKARSVQWYLKNGPTKRLNEVLKYYLCSSLKEARTSRIKDFKKSEIISFLKYLKGEVSNDVSFSATEKIAGQSMTVGIKGTQRGNVIYCATKDMLMQSDNDIFNYRFMKSKATSGLVKHAFIKKFRKLSPGEKVVLGMEVVISDYKKPDYIAYHVPRGKEYAAIFSIEPEGSFTRQDASRLSGKYWNPKSKKSSELKVLLPEDIPLTPDVNIDEEVTREIDELIEIVEQAPLGKDKDPDIPVKAYIHREVSPRVRSLVKIIFPSSNINATSPIEGIAVNMSSGDNTSFFKVPSEDFDRLQSIQASVYAEFKTNRRGRTYQRAQGFIDQLSNPTTNQSFARNTFKLIKYLHDIDTLPSNYRTFFSPGKFKSFCRILNQGLEASDVSIISSALRLFSKRLYTSKGIESFRSAESDALVQFIEQNNLI